MMEQIVFQYKILSGDVLKSQADLRKAIENTNKELQSGTKKSVAQQKALETQLKTLTRIYRGELNAGIRQSKKEFDASGAAGVDAYRKTAAQLAIVTRNIKNLRVENKAVPAALQKQFTTLRGQISQADKSVGDFRRNVGNYGSGLKGLGVKLLGAFGFVGGISLIGNQMRKIIQDAQQIAVESKGIEFAFDRLGKGGMQAFDDVKASTSGLLSDLDIKKSIVEFDNFNISQQEVGTLLQFVSVRAAQTGKSIDNLRDSLVEGLSKESKLRIDNLGISASELNSELKKTPNFVQAVSNIAKRELAEAGDILDEAGNAQSRYNAAYQNFLLGISKSDVIQGFTTNILDLKTAVFEFLTPNQLLSEQVEKEQTDVNVLVQRITDLNTSQGDRQRLINELDAKYPFFLEKIDKEKVSNEQLTQKLIEVNDQYVTRLILQKQEEKIQSAAETLADKRGDVLEKERDIQERLTIANREFGLNLDLTNSSLAENADAVQKALDKRADFSISLKTDNVRLNAEGKSLRDLSNDLRTLSQATEDQTKADASLVEIQTERTELAKQLGLTLEEINKLFGSGGDGDKTKIPPVTPAKELKAQANSIAAITDEISELEKALNKTNDQSKIKELVEDIASKKDELADLKKTIDNLFSKASAGSIKTLNEDISSLKKELNETTDKNVIEDILRDIASKESELARVKKTIKDISDSLSKGTIEGDIIETAQALADLESFEKKIAEVRNNPLPIVELAALTGLDQTKILPNQLEIFERIAQSQIDIEKLTAQERLEIEINHLEKVRQERIKLGQDTLEIDRNLGQKKAQFKEAEIKIETDNSDALKKIIIDRGIEIAQSLLSLQASIDERNFQRQATQLEQEFALKLEGAEGNAEEQEKIQEELEEKRRIIAEEAFKKRKENEIKAAIIGQAQAIIAAASLPFPFNFAQIAAITILTGIQIAKIKAQEFAKTGIIVPNKKSDQPIFTQLGEGGSVPLGQFAKGKRHSQGGIKAIMNGRFVEYEQGEFVDKDEHGNIHVVNRRNSTRFRDQLTSMAGQSFTGKGQALATINNHTSAGYIKAVEGQIIQSITETPRQVIAGNSQRLTSADIDKLGDKLADKVSNAVKQGINDLIQDQRISEEFENSRSA